MIRANDENNDWIFGIGANAYKKNNDAIAQNIKTKLQEWVGDCFFDLTAGIDWLNRLNDSTRILLEEDISSLILKVDGVVNLVNLDIIFNDRKFTLDYNVQTIYSQNIIDSINLIR